VIAGDVLAFATLPAKPFAETTEAVVTVPVVATVQPSALPEASTPSGKLPAEQLVPFAASAVVVPERNDAAVPVSSAALTAGSCALPFSCTRLLAEVPTAYDDPHAVPVE
jgi:hypothetical protein